MNIYSIDKPCDAAALKEAALSCAEKHNIVITSKIQDQQ